MIKSFTHLMKPSEYGKLGLVSSISSLLITTLISPFMQGASRYYLNSAPLLSFKYVENFLNKILITISIVTLFSIFYFIYKSNFLDSVILLLLLITVIIDTRGQWYTSFLHLNRKRIEYTISTSIFNWLKIVIALILILLFPKFSAIIFVLIGWIISSYISNIYSKNRLSILNNDFKNSINHHTEKSLDTKSLKVFVVNFVILNIFLWIQGWADKWILNYNFGESSELGIYISHNQVAMIPFVALNGLIIMYYGPIIYQKIASNSHAINLNEIRIKINQLKNYYLFFSFFLIIILFYLTPFILKLLLNNQYPIDRQIFFLCSLSSLLFNYSQIQSFSIQCTGKLKNILLPNIYIGILLVIVNLFFSKQYGILGSLLILNLMMFLKIVILNYYEKKSWFLFMNSSII